MKIMKFGGTSVGKPERMFQVKDLITRDNEPKIVVLSALSGTTNTLVAIGDAMSCGDKDKATSLIQQLHAHYKNFINELLVKIIYIYNFWSVFITVRIFDMFLENIA